MLLKGITFHKIFIVGIELNPSAQIIKKAEQGWANHGRHNGQITYDF